MAGEAMEIQPMVRGDLDTAIEWAMAEGWNPGLSDADAFWAADPGAHHIGRIDGRPAATLSAARYGDAFAFVGFYIVAPRWRGEGHGLAIWRSVLDDLGPRVLGLDGVVEQEATYERDGFVTAWRNERRELPDPSSLLPSGATVPLDDVPFEAIVADDARVFPAERSVFLRAWLAVPGSVGRAVVDDGELVAWGVVRPAREGRKVGPLVASSSDAADAVLRDLAAGGDGPVYLDIPGCNPAAVDLAELHGMQPMFQTLRMYRGEPEPVETDRIFGITTFELG